MIGISGYFVVVATTSAAVDVAAATVEVVRSSINVKGVGDVVKAVGNIGVKNPPKILELSGNFGAGTRSA